MERSEVIHRFCLSTMMQSYHDYVKDPKTNVKNQAKFTQAVRDRFIALKTASNLSSWPG